MMPILLEHQIHNSRRRRAVSVGTFVDQKSSVFTVICQQPTDACDDQIDVGSDEFYSPYVNT